MLQTMRNDGPIIEPRFHAPFACAETGVESLNSTPWSEMAAPRLGGYSHARLVAVRGCGSGTCLVRLIGPGKSKLPTFLWV